MFIQFDGVIGACVITESTAGKSIGQAPIGVYFRLPKDDGFLGSFCWFCEEGLRGTRLGAQRDAVVFLGAEIAIVLGKVQHRGAHSQKAVFNMGGDDDVARADFGAFLAANARG